MSKEIINQANDHVRQIEINYATHLLSEYKQSLKAANGCGCRSCLNYHQSLIEKMEDEAWRLNPAHATDPDEDKLTSYAIRRLNERTAKGKEDLG